MTEGLELTVSSDGFAVVRINNGRNMMRLSTTQAWAKVLDKVESNENVKGLVITGHGKVFCLGRDLDFLAKQDSDYMKAFTLANEELYKRLITFPVPTVAVLNGHTFGGGAMLALSCDYRVMRSDRGWLSWPEAALGMRFRPVTMGILRSKLPDGVVFRDAILYCKRFAAPDAKRLGLVDAIGEESQLMDEAKLLLTETLGTNGVDRQSLVRMKQDIYGKHIEFSKI